MLEAILQCSALADAYCQSLVKCAHKFPAISHTMETGSPIGEMSGLGLL